MEFKVYELATNIEVTDKHEWYIDTAGNLYFATDDVDAPLYMASGEYYYKLEIEVL